MVQPTSGAMESTRANHVEWFTAEVKPHDAALRRYLQRSFPEVRDVDDIVQESHLRLWRARTGGAIASARAFLFRVARNFALDRVRRRRRSPIREVGDSNALDVVEERPDAAEVATSRELINLLDDALAALPRRQRQVVILCKLQSKSCREAALALGLAEKTVTEHLYRALPRLGEELQRRGVHGFRR